MILSIGQSPATTPTQGPQLRDIHLPAEPSWWPPAPGWWMLATLSLVMLLAGVCLWRRQRRSAGQRAQVLAELDELIRQHQHDGDQAALASGLHQLLRRVARRHDALATQQRGEAWRQTLARVPVDAVTLDRLLQLDRAMYQPKMAFDHAAASTAVRHWLNLALKPGAWKSATTERQHA